MARAYLSVVTSATRQLLGFDDRWLLLAGIPVVSLITFLLFVPLQGGFVMTPREVALCYVLGLAHTTLYWVCLRQTVVQLRRSAWLRERLGLRIGLTVVVAFAVIGVVEATGFLEAPLEWAVIGEGVRDWEPPVLFTVVISIVLCAMVLGVYETMYFLSKYRDGLVTQERMARAEMQSQLVNLREQVNPHFLFNSLNTLASVIPEDPALATRFVQRLSAVYRRVLDHGLSETVTLGEELDALQDYLFLLETRFEDKLRVDIAVAPEERALRVVPLALQLLVENAVKHNVVSERRPLSIRVAVVEGGLHVVNALQPRRGQVESAGVGLANLRQRYGLLGAEGMRVRETAEAFAVTLPLLPAEVPGVHPAGANAEREDVPRYV